MTVHQLECTISPSEFVSWIALSQLESDTEVKQDLGREAQNKLNNRKPKLKSGKK